MKSDRLYLAHIAESIERIRDYTQAGEHVFLTTRMVQDAVVRNFEIIGEAAGKVSAETTANSPIPWAQLRSFRNFLIHQYSGVDIRAVWKAIRDDLPALEHEIAVLRAKFEHQ